MADGIRAKRRLRAVQAAAHPARWALLAHAVRIGPFAATEAADIAGLPPTSGTARTTHAGTLCDVGLLGRDKQGGLVFRATDEGRRMFEELRRLIRENNVDSNRVLHLAEGESLDLAADLARSRSGSSRNVRLKITRER